ncbi:tripartite tricarboxylate transporter substrate binding protein [Alcaligenaceae bacterium A4P071]|nr:tripartite tricarboxylate transporter substrate binding protein [Alcaligenaceae bacterium A4P071]
MKLNTLIAALATAVAGVTAASTASAQTYPTKPIRLIVGFAPGGSNDIIARLLAPKLGDVLKQQVVVENRPGAAGNIAADVVLKAPPDGHTIFMCTTGTLSIQPFLPQRMPFDVNDIAPITQIGNTPYLMLVNKDLPATSVKTFIDYAKSHPNQVNFASSGNGTTAHLAGEMLRSKANIDIVHVPYKGAGQAMVDLTSGRVSLMFDQAVSSMPQVNSGSLRALAVVSAHRLPSLPNLPTTSEAGLPGFDPIPWTGLCTARGVPDDAIATLQKALAQVLTEPAVRDRLLADGIEPIGSTPAEFAAFLAADKTKWGGLVKNADIKPE